MSEAARELPVDEPVMDGPPANEPTIETSAVSLKGPETDNPAEAKTVEVAAVKQPQFTVGAEVAGFGEQGARVVRELGDDLRIVERTSKDGSTYEQCVSVDQLARNTERYELESNALEIAQAALDVYNIPQERADAILDHLAVVAEQLTAGDPASFDRDAMTREMRRVARDMALAEPGTQGALTAEVIKEHAADRKAILEAALSREYEPSDVLDLAERLNLSMQDMADALASQVPQEAIAASEHVLETVTAPIEQLREAQITAQSPSELEAATKALEALLPSLTVIATALRERHPQLATQVEQVRQGLETPPPEPDPQLSGEQLVGAFFQRLKEWASGEKPNKAGQQTAETSGAAAAASEQTPDAATEQRDANPRESDGYKLGRALYERTATKEERDQFRQLIQDTKDQFPEYQALAEDIESKHVTCLYDLQEALAESKQNLPAVETQTPDTPASAPETPPEAPTTPAEATTETPAAAEPAEATAPTATEKPDPWAGFGQSHEQSFQALQRVLQGEIARMPQAYAGSNIEELANADYQRYQDLQDLVDRRRGSIMQRMNPWSSYHKAQKEVARLDYLMQSAAEQLAPNIAEAPLGTAAARETLTESPDYLKS